MLKKILLASALCVCLVGADFAGQPLFERWRPLMGTSFGVRVFESDLSAEDLARTVDQALDLVASLEEKMSSYKEGSLIGRINRAKAGETFDLDDDTYQVMREALRVSRLSGGAFDVTVWPLKKLWKRAKQTREPPTPEEINSALRDVGYQYILLDSFGKKLSLKKEGVQIDLGGIAKGYAVQEAARFLKNHGVRSAIVDGRSSVSFVGRPTGAPHWRVGIEHPRKPDTYAAVLELPEPMAVSTSGDYEDFFLHDGKRYSHIFDPHTGASPPSRVVSVTVVSENATLADGLDTAFFVLGSEKGFKMLEALGDESVQAVCIEEDVRGRLTLSTSGKIQSYLQEINL